MFAVTVPWSSMILPFSTGSLRGAPAAGLLDVVMRRTLPRCGPALNPPATRRSTGRVCAVRGDGYVHACVRTAWSTRRAPVPGAWARPSDRRAAAPLPDRGGHRHDRRREDRAGRPPLRPRRPVPRARVRIGGDGAPRATRPAAARL